MYEVTPIWKDVLESRQYTYDALRKLFVLGPSIELLLSLVDSAKNVETNAGGDSNIQESNLVVYLKDLSAEKIAKLYDEVKLEYARLFIGPYHLLAPPYESVYRSPERLMMQEPAIQVRRLYEAAGLKVENIGKNPDDYIGLEFEFIYYLNFLAISALDDCDFQTAAELVGQQLQFLDEHMIQWIPSFCDDIIINTKLEFFKSLAEFIKVFITEDCMLLRQLAKESNECLAKN